ncbi:MAG: hypothetical protein A2283_14255 [Lentisphaerae bacterium RIFOXYA12_FULL_48_11]|nr:MAG: hypothetical protein A2283_14255 [Lentisphaerae bacterium RIFOXYA12_FULL_48_11]
MKHILKVDVLKDYKLRLEFADGVSGIVDVSALVGKGVFALWSDYAEFRKVQIGSSGELVWRDQVDLCPDSLYMKITKRQPEEMFPSLKLETTCA